MSQLLDPKVLLAIKDLSLAAKTTVDGFMAGIHKSNVKGTGMEFSQYRSYQPGDDLRSLDWKMYARSDRYYIRESETETSVSVRFVVDASASMDHKDGQFTKMDYARYLAACLAYLANSQGDSIGLYVFRDGDLFSLPCRKDHQHLSRYFYQLENIKPAGKFTEPVNYKDIFAGTHKRELLIFITDFYEDHGEISELLTSFVALRHEIMLFHLMGRNELDFDFKSFQAVEDLETGDVVAINAQVDLNAYQQKLNAFIEDKKAFALNKNIFYRLTGLDEPVDKALRDFINQRNKLKA
ncbi:MAG TPA: DUF58 domain-containing protein [Flavitalea sp.]|nr:DUF58 domain-containing protein [Flavitalea sp.]